MVETQKAIELSVKEYIASLGLNPRRVKYKKITSTNVTTTSAQWAFKSPDRRALLLSCGWINWKATITKRTIGEVPEGFIRNGIRASWKPCLPFANSMSNIQLQINGASISMSQPRRFMSVLNMMFAGRKGAEQSLQTAGGNFPDLDGYSNNAASNRGVMTGPAMNRAIVAADVPAHGNILNTTAAELLAALNALRILSGSGNVVVDKSLWKKQQYFLDQLAKSNNANGIGVNDLNGTNNRVIQCFEPLIAPPFNPFLYLKKGMPDYCWFKNMSPMIPHCNSIELQINFQKLSASAIFTQYLRSADAALKKLTISALDADLHLWWYIPPLNYQLPRQITLQTWRVSEFVQDVGLVNNNVESANVQTTLIEVKSVPSLIVIHAEVDKDSANYTNIALQCDQDQAGTNPTQSLANNSLDSFMEIRHLEIDIGTAPQVISTQFKQQELYNLTKKNSKMLDFPWDYYTWKGAHMASPNPLGARYNQMSRCFVALRPNDIANQFGAGIRYPMQLQFTMNLIARDGLNGIPGGNKNYKLYVHTFFGKHYMEITPDTASYKLQTIDMNIALQQHRIPTASQIDDGRYQSRSSQI
ncbi:MAG: hypothetical protein GY756_20535 [bacterium]|nr:hypothetical protein [bacterium]